MSSRTRERFDAVFLSPHLDDAVFSCGAEIHRRTRLGERVAVVTLFAGAPPATLSSFAAEIHELWAIPTDVIAQRRAEDRLAVQSLGAEPLHMDLPDALYREGPDGHPLFESLDALRSAPLDDPTLEAVTATIARLPEAATVFAPLAVGAHVDHRLTHLGAKTSPASRDRLIYYEDFPYAAHLLPRLRALWPPLRHRRARQPRSSVADRKAKGEAALLYESQLRALDEPPQSFRQRVVSQPERYWRDRAGRPR